MKAIAFSFGSKISSFALQILGLGMAVRYLRPDGYAEYATLLAASAAPSLAIMTYGPKLVADVSTIAVGGDGQALRKVFWSVFVTIASNVAIVGLIFSLLLLTSSGSVLAFADESSGLTKTVLDKHLWVLLLLIWINLLSGLLTSMEDIQVGMNESHLLSIRSAVANGISIAALLFVFRPSPSLLSYILCIQGSLFFCRLINLLAFTSRYRLWAISVSNWDMRGCLKLIADGVVFKLASGWSAYICHQLPVILMAFYAEKQRTAELSSSISLVLQLYAIVSMIATPFVPALVGSIRVKDLSWAGRSYDRIFVSILVYGTISTIALFLLGTSFSRWWFDDLLTWSSPLCFFMGVYVTSIGLEYFSFVILCALGKQNLAVTIYLLRAALTVLPILISSKCEDPVLFFAGASVFAVVCTLINYSLTKKFLRIVNVISVE